MPVAHSPVAQNLEEQHVSTPPSLVTRPLLRHDAAFLETHDGLYIRMAGDGFLIRGRGAYAYMSALLPHLDGRTTVDELVGGLPEAHATSVRTLLGCLQERDVLIDRPDVSAAVPIELANAFAGQVSLLTHYGDDGSGFLRAASARILVVADDEQLSEAASDCLAANGVGAGLAGDVSGASLGMVLATVSDGGPGLLDQRDLVIVVTPVSHDGRLLALARATVTHHAGLLPVHRVDDSIVIGPWQAPADDHRWFESLVLRLSDNGEPAAVDLMRSAAVGLPPARPLPALSPGAEELAVSMAAFEAFKMLSGCIASDVDGGIVILQTDTLESRHEKLTPHPLVDDSGKPHDATPSNPSDDPLEGDYVRFRHLVQDRVGVVRRFRDDDVPQIPVRAAVLDAPAVRTEAFIEFGTDNVLACRLRTLERASAEYALLNRLRRPSLPPAPPGATLLEGAALHGFLGGVDRAPGLLLAHDAEGLTYAVDVDAVLAHPLSRRNTRFNPTLDGLAAGPTVEAARERATWHAARAVATDDVVFGRTPLAEVSKEAAQDHDAVLRSLVVAASAEGLEIELFGALGPIPTAAVNCEREGRRETVVRAGPTWASAVGQCLLHIVGRHQLRTSAWAEKDAAIWSADRGAAAVLTDAAIVTAEPHEVGLGTALDLAGLCSVLASRGLVPLHVDLTTPDLRGATHVSRALLRVVDRPVPACPLTSS